MLPKLSIVLFCLRGEARIFSSPKDFLVWLRLSLVWIGPSRLWDLGSLTVSSSCLLSYLLPLDILSPLSGILFSFLVFNPVTVPAPACVSRLPLLSFPTPRTSHLLECRVWVPAYHLLWIGAPVSSGPHQVHLWRLPEFLLQTH